MSTGLTVAERRTQGAGDVARRDIQGDLLVRVQGEYREMPGLRLTTRQAARLFDMPPDVADAVLNELRRTAVLTLSIDGAYALSSEGAR